MQPGQSINLLDSKHYSLTKDQIQNSLTSGSLYKRSDKVVVRNIPPAIQNTKGPARVVIDESGQFPSRVRSLLEHKEFNYDELQITDDEYAKDNADLAEEDDLGRYKK